MLPSYVTCKGIHVNITNYTSHYQEHFSKFFTDMKIEPGNSDSFYGLMGNFHPLFG